MGERRSASVRFIFITLLLDTLGIGLVVPVMPRLIASVLGGDVAAASEYYGAFLSTYAAMQFVFAPILGGLSDRFGRKPIILIALFGACLHYLLIALAPTLGLLFLGRILSGITGASFSAATAYIADITPPEKRAQSFGLVGAAFGLGFILGPAVGGLLGETSLRLPFFAAAALNFANFVYGLFVLPESLAPDNRRAFTIARANPFTSLRNLAKHPTLLGLTLTLTLGYVAQQILQSVWALYTEGRYGWSATEVGFSLTLVGIATAVVQGALLKRAMPRLGERRALLLGATASMLGFTALGLADRGWLLCLFILPFSLRGFAGPAIQALLTREVAPSEQGELQGSLGSLQSIAAIVGPLLGARLFGVLGARDAALYLPGAPFFLAAALEAIGLVFAARLLFGRRARDAAKGAGPDSPRELPTNLR